MFPQDTHPEPSFPATGRGVQCFQRLVTKSARWYVRVMALQPKSVFEARKADQYTGTNSADFADEIADFTVVSETASGLTFTSAGTTYTVAPNGYIAWLGTDVTDVFQNEDDYRDTYTVLDEAVSLNHVHRIATGPGEAVPA